MAVACDTHSICEKDVKAKEDIKSEKRDQVAQEDAMGDFWLLHIDKEPMQKDRANHRSDHWLDQVTKDETCVLKDEKFDENKDPYLHNQTRSSVIHSVLTYLGKLSHQDYLVKIDTLLGPSEIEYTVEEEIAEAKCGDNAQPLANKLHPQIRLD